MTNTFVAVAYDDMYTAQEVRLRLLRMQKEYLIDLEDAVVAVRDEQGKVIGSTGTATDLSERKRSEEALRLIVEGTSSATTSEEFFRSLVYQLAKVLGTRYSFVGRIIDSAPEYVETLAVWWEDYYYENFTYLVATMSEARTPF